MTTGAIPRMAALAIASIASAHSTGSVDLLQPHTQSTGPVTSPRVMDPAPSVIPTDETPPVAVRRVRLESALPIDTVPSVNLKFELLNEGLVSLVDIVVRVSIVEAEQSGDSMPREEVLAGPFTVHGKVTLKPGGVMKYEMRLRGLTTDCGCRPAVAVLSVRKVGER